MIGFVYKKLNMFSIIIPVYNKENYIQKTILSIINQTYNDYEIIIINDGSTDYSLEIIEKFNFINADYKIINQENAGVSTARNNGVKIAKHDYIAFLDADDWWEPTFLEKMHDLITKYPDASLYASSYYKVKRQNNIIAQLHFEDNFHDGYINYINIYSKGLWMPIWTGATIIKKDVFEKLNGFNSNLILGEDFDLWIRVSLNYQIAFINEPLSNYNQDVDEHNRLVVSDKIYPPQKHFIFNLDYLIEIEKKNKDLKILLDRLRLYTLLRYRLSGLYVFEYQKEFNKIEFEDFSIYDYIKFHLPIFTVKFYYNVLNFISIIKSNLQSIFKL